MMLDDEIQEDFDIKDLSSIPPYDGEGEINEFVNQIIENYDWDSFYTSKNIASNVEEVLDWVTENVTISKRQVPTIAWEAVNHLYQNNAFPNTISKSIEEALDLLDEAVRAEALKA